MTEEVTKQAIRRKVWHCLEKNDLAHFPRPVYGRIPNFKGSPEAAQKLSELDIFKGAYTIKVTPDKPQEAVRFLVLEARKNLLVPIPSLRSGLLLHVVPPSDASKQELKVAATQQGSEQWGKPVGLDAKVKVDLIVLGSVAVSKEGYRVGKGEGYADLEFAMMMKMGAVDQNTVIAATVHDCQVFETLPSQLFKENDVPVDFIITPTQVIEVNPRLPRPSGINWSLLSERRLNDIPILQTLRDAEMCEGKDCTLKEVDSDVGEHPRASGHGYRRNRFRRRHGIPKSPQSEKGVEGPQLSVIDGEDIQNKRPFRRPRPAARKQTSSTPKHGYGKEVNKDENVTGNITKKEQHRPARPRQRPGIEFSLKVGNIASNVRVRDLKAALAERGIKPTDITWRGHRGFAFLHFAKAGGSRNTVSSAPIAVDSIVASLQDLRVGTEGGEDFLKIEPAKPITRIEVTDISSV
ncbi:methenyltetrahydrofolate synthase domain-containing protein isoform X3 [Cryptotermes secundus]|uniref:methenyltetrahydrofolate synthase domain-containing protein isoform X3 n=1 Tax=Cryptotermes secundus TaxID=105785 RepID=UPI000CD7B0CB|nr:methenyltetrahydrofolate synthase domain-containing protein isoform X3 [Cryptotermes secundus]